MIQQPFHELSALLDRVQKLLQAYHALQHANAQLQEQTRQVMQERDALQVQVSNANVFIENLILQIHATQETMDSIEQTEVVHPKEPAAQAEPSNQLSLEPMESKYEAN